jgi:hypothetical protein
LPYFYRRCAALRLLNSNINAFALGGIPFFSIKKPGIVEKKPSVFAFKREGFRTFAHYFWINHSLSQLKEPHMKLIYSLLIFLAGVGLTFLGLILKLESFEYASQILTIGLILQLAGGGLLLFKALARAKK